MKRILLLGAALAVAAPAMAQVAVRDAWVRATVTGQKSTGAFMKIVDPAGGRLVEVHSGAAAVVELHEMSMEGTTMRMRPVAGIDLPAGKPVELKPGAFHVMLTDLKQPLADGDSVDLILVVEGKDKKRETVEVKATVRGAGKH
jgi:periplasmic copper chaperone A